MTALSVGAPWPHGALGEGMQALMQPGDEALALTLVCAMAGPTPPERKALRKGPLRIGLLPAPPLVWLLLAGKDLSFDAPYGLGLSGAERGAALRAAADLARTWPPGRRGLASIILVDTDTQLVAGLRAITLSRDWYIALADALDLSPPDLSPRERDAAIARDLGHWTHTKDMLAAATASEIGGRL